MATTDLRILQSTSVPKAVQHEIQRLILSGTFKPGQKLAEAEWLSVSRGPIREAFRGLEESCFIRVSKNRGVFVRELTLEDANELYEVRAGLDATAGSLLAPRITDAQLAELERLVDKMDAVLSSNDLPEYFQNNFVFHDRIVETTGNRKLLEVYRRVTNETRLMRRLSISKGGGQRVLNEEHRDIVKALATRNADEAVRVMRAHVTKGGNRFIAAWSAEVAAEQAVPEAAAAPQDHH